MAWRESVITIIAKAFDEVVFKVIYGWFCGERGNGDLIVPDMR
jgi:hypothetical protein